MIDRQGRGFLPAERVVVGAHSNGGLQRLRLRQMSRPLRAPRFGLLAAGFCSTSDCAACHDTSGSGQSCSYWDQYSACVTANGNYCSCSADESVGSVHDSMDCSPYVSPPAPPPEPPEPPLPPPPPPPTLLPRGLAFWDFVQGCSDQMTYKTMANMFSGPAQMGARGCLNEFNRIPVEVLSVVAGQYSSILDAITAKKSSFLFDKETTSLTQLHSVLTRLAVLLVLPFCTRFGVALSSAAWVPTWRRGGQRTASGASRPPWTLVLLVLLLGMARPVVTGHSIIVLPPPSPPPVVSGPPAYVSLTFSGYSQWNGDYTYVAAGESYATFDLFTSICDSSKPVYVASSGLAGTLCSRYSSNDWVYTYHNGNGASLYGDLICPNNAYDADPTACTVAETTYGLATITGHGSIMPPPPSPPPAPPAPPASPDPPPPPPHLPSLLSDITCSAGSYGSEVSWQLSCDDGTSLSGGAPYASEAPVVVQLGSSCLLEMKDSFGDGWNSAEWDAPGFGVQGLTIPTGYAANETFIVADAPSPPPLSPSPPPTPPWSCGCETVSVVLAGDALNEHPNAAGEYTLLDGFTSGGRAVHVRSGDNDAGVCSTDNCGACYDNSSGSGQECLYYSQYNACKTADGGHYCSCSAGEHVQVVAGVDCSSYSSAALPPSPPANMCQCTGSGNEVSCSVTGTLHCASGEECYEATGTSHPFGQWGCLCRSPDEPGDCPAPAPAYVLWFSPNDSRWHVTSSLSDADVHSILACTDRTDASISGSWESYDSDDNDSYDNDSNETLGRRLEYEAEIAGCAQLPSYLASNNLPSVAEICATPEARTETRWDNPSQTLVEACPVLCGVCAAHLKSGADDATCPEGAGSWLWESSPWYLAPLGALECDSGADVALSECEAAVAWIASELGQTPGRTLQSSTWDACVDDGGWSSVPDGCSAQ